MGAQGLYGFLNIGLAHLCVEIGQCAHRSWRMVSIVQRCLWRLLGFSAVLVFNQIACYGIEPGGKPALGIESLRLFNDFTKLPPIENRWVYLTDD